MADNAKTAASDQGSPPASPAAAAAASEGSIEETQKRLAAHGYRIEVNGIMTRQTIDAIRGFQVNNGLEPTGVVGRGKDDETWAKLKEKPAERD